jgi:hypothetical protein
LRWLFLVPMVLGPVGAAANAAQFEAVSQSMSLGVELFDQFGKLEVSDSFSELFGDPVDVTLDESVAVQLFGGVNEASGTLGTQFGGVSSAGGVKTLTGSATLSLLYGGFPSDLAGSTVNRIAVGFDIVVDEPTAFSFDFAIGQAAGGSSMLFDDLWLFGDDGTVFAHIGTSGLGDQASGSGVFQPGVRYEFLASLDSGFEELDNIDPLISLSTAFAYELVIIPAPGAAMVLVAGLGAGVRRPARRLCP